MSKTIKQDALDLYKAPFKHTCGYIHDSAGSTVSDAGSINEGHESFVQRVRGWGRIQYLDNPAELQDQVGELIAEALTVYWSLYGSTDLNDSGKLQFAHPIGQVGVMCAAWSNDPSIPEECRDRFKTILELIGEA